MPVTIPHPLDAPPAPFTLVTDHHHLVETNGVVFRKTGKPTSATAAAELALEAAVLSALGVWHLHDLSAPSVTTKSMGAPVEIIDAAFIASAVATHLRTNATEIELLPAPEALIDRARGKILRRLGTEHKLAVIALGALDGLELCPGNRTGLVHSDAHRLNWLLDEHGDAVLIDWELAVAGPVELDLAVLAHDLIAFDHAHLLPIVEAAVVDEAAFQWGITVKIASALSGVTWHHGEEAGRARLELMAPLLQLV